MPEIYNPANSLIRAYLSGAQFKEERQQREIKNQLDREKFEEEQKQHLDQLKQRQEEFKATQSLRDAIHRAEVAQQRFAITKGAAETGLAPGELTGESVNQSPEESMYNMGTGGPAPIITRSYNVDGIGQINVPDPYSYARQKAGLEDIGNQPDINKAVKIAEGIDKARLPGQLQLEGMREANARLLREAQDKAAYERTIQAAKIRAQATLSNKLSTQAEKDEALNSVLPQLTNGDYTLEDIPVTHRLQAQGRLAASGARAITKKDKDALEGLGLVRQVFEKYNQLADEYHKAGVLGILSPKVNDIASEADALAGRLARVYSDEKGVLTEKDIARIKGMRPSYRGELGQKFAKSETNQRRLTEFLRFYREKVNQVKGKMSPDQDSAINERFGLIIPLKKKVNYNGQEVKAISNDNGKTYKAQVE